MVVHTVKLPNILAKKSQTWTYMWFSGNFTMYNRDNTFSCILWTVVMALIRSSHQGAASLFMCNWCVRWNQSKPGRTTRKVLVESATPHCSFPLCAQPMSQSALDDGALSFRVERALKVRVGQRPSSLILAGFCHLVQQDKWTFDTQSDHTLAQPW